MNRENFFPEGLIIGIVLGLFFMYFGARNYYRAELIKHGYGQYTSQTGKFEWLAGGSDE